jgi:hypothetical protein
MLRPMRSILLVSIFCFISTMVGIASAEDQAIHGNARTLSKQEVLDLISNKKIIYMTSKATSASDLREGSLEVRFKKTDESGGTLMAYANGNTSGSSSGKWYVTDDSRLVRQYDLVKWGNKPFQSTIVVKNGKYFVRFGAAEDHEIVTIE